MSKTLQAAKQTPSRPPAVDRERRPAVAPVLAPDRWPVLHDRIGNQAAARHLQRRAALSATTVPQRTMDAPLTLQRKCACGGGDFGGECEECSKKKLGLQTKLRIGAPQDAYEQEADRVAARVTGTSPPPMTSPSAAAERLVASQTDELEPSELTAGGSPLPSSLRGFFERRFGRDLGEVRLHAGAQAEARSEQLNAHAFTYGSHIWLGKGHSAAPGFLLAHELAHVIQQRQPRALPGSEGRDPSTTKSAAPRIQRRGLTGSVPFWVPLGAKGKKTGTDLHKELLGKVKEKYGEMDVEANAPNADLYGCGLDHRGSIDLYRSTPRHVMPGFYFGTVSLKNFPGVTKDAPSGLRPYADGKRIEGTVDAPTTVELGELKPASKPMVDAGKDQLNDYLCGMNKAVELTNKWAAIVKAPPWKLPVANVKKLPSSDVSVAEGEPTDLVVADIKETSDRGAKYKTDVRPAWVTGALQVRGRVHVIALPGTGLWVYYAKPENLGGTLTGLRSENIHGEIIVANTVQDEVIEPLMRPPEQLSPLRKVRVLPADRPNRVQRKPKYDQPPGKFKETFPLKGWLERQGKLRTQIQSPTGDTKKQLADLEKFDDAYDANEELAKISGTGVSTLAGKKVDLIDVFRGSGATKTKITHPPELGKLFGWLKHWTGKPAEILGVFRSLFGGAFIKVAEFFSGAGDWDLLKKIKQTAANLFDKIPFPSGAFGDVLKEGLKFALLRISDLLIPSVFRMLTGSIKKGVVIALKGVFEEELETLEGWKTKIDDFMKKIEGILKPALDIISDLMEVVRKAGQITNMVKKAENAIEWGIRLAECSGVWSCLLILAEPFTDRLKDEAIYALKDKILSACGVRSLLGGAVRRLLFGVPFDIASGILGLAKKLASAIDAPKPVQTIFSQGVDREDPPELKEMEDNDCWGIDLGFSLFDEGFTHTKKKDEPPSPPTKPSAPPPTTAPTTPPTKAPTTPPTKTPAPPPPPPAPPPKLQTPAPTPTQGPFAAQRPWDATALSITFHTDKESSVYIESLLEQSRHAKPAEYDLGCLRDGYFAGDVWFFVDDPSRWRPEPFRPPTVGVSWKAGNRHDGNIDTKPTYEPRAAFLPGTAHPLKTSFGLDLKIPVSAGDVLQLWFTLVDLDTGKTLLYQENIKITYKPCA